MLRFFLRVCISCTFCCYALNYGFRRRKIVFDYLDNCFSTFHCINISIISNSVEVYSLCTIFTQEGKKK